MTTSQLANLRSANARSCSEESRHFDWDLERRSIPEHVTPLSARNFLSGLESDGYQGDGGNSFATQDSVNDHVHCGGPCPGVRTGQAEKRDWATSRWNDHSWDQRHPT